MTFIALLDANVLVNGAVRDTLLRAAEADLYQLAISKDILDEMSAALERALGLTRGQTDYLKSEILNAFESALVEGHERLIPVMENEEGDRHVLAAAVQAGANTIVTFNLRHFLEALCRHMVWKPSIPTASWLRSKTRTRRVWRSSSTGRLPRSAGT